MPSPFNKSATTCAQQVTLLQSRGMQINDAASAEFYLRHLNYYRLSAYWLPFEADHATHQFKPGTTFEDVLNLYTFDRELRLLIMDAIERVEVSVRTQWAYQLSLLHGPHAHLNPSLHNPSYWQANFHNLTGEVSRSDEVFVQHFRVNYSEPLPPIWAVCEVMSLGLLSRWYGSLRPAPTRRAISAPYQLDESVLESWLHHLSVVRNICAHHARLWNREFTITPIRPRSRPAILPPEFMVGSRKIYNTLLFLVYMLDTVSPRHSWRKRLKDLIAAHQIPVARMGFPADWLARPIWQEVSPTP